MSARDNALSKRQSTKPQNQNGKAALASWHQQHATEINSLLTRTACVLSEGGFDTGEARPLASIAYGVCKGGVPRPNAQMLLNALRPVACNRLGELRAVELSQLLWAYATVGVNGAECVARPSTAGPRRRGR